MALAAQKALLDELMGKNRDAAPNERVRTTHWSDDEVCKFYLAGLCPHDLFTNTRVDLGTCPNLHDEKLLEEYRGSNRFERMGYEDDLYRYCNNLIADVERKIRRGHARLELNAENNLPALFATSANAERIKTLSTNIEEMLAKMEKLGNEGRVEEAQAIMSQCEAAKRERMQLEAEQNVRLIYIYLWRYNMLWLELWD